MKEDIKVMVVLEAGQETGAKHLFERIGRKDLIQSHYPDPYWLSLDSPAEAALILSEWKALGLGTLEPFIRWNRTYAEAELASAPLLHLIVRRPEKGYGGPRYGTEFDLSSACPTCGAGARQSGPLKVKPNELAKGGEITQTLGREILFSDELVDRFERAAISGVQFWPVELVQAGRSSPWKQLIVEYTMPALSDKTEGILRNRPCAVCGRDGYFQTASHPEVLRFRHGDVNVAALPDVAQTYELFGNSVLRQPLSTSHFPKGLILVKPSVYQLLKDVKSIEFVPVELE